MWRPGILQEAVAGNKVEVVRRIVKQSYNGGGGLTKSQLDDADYWGETALMRAANRQVRRDRDGLEIISTLWEGYRALSESCGGGQEVYLRDVLMTRDKMSHWNLLMFAARSGDLDKLKLVHSFYQPLIDGGLIAKSHLRDACDWNKMDAAAKTYILDHVLRPAAPDPTPDPTPDRPLAAHTKNKQNEYDSSSVFEIMKTPMKPKPSSATPSTPATQETPYRRKNYHETSMENPLYLNTSTSVSSPPVVSSSTTPTNAMSALSIHSQPHTYNDDHHSTTTPTSPLSLFHNYAPQSQQQPHPPTQTNEHQNHYPNYHDRQDQHHLPSPKYNHYNHLNHHTQHSQHTQQNQHPQQQRYDHPINQSQIDSLKSQIDQLQSQLQTSRNQYQTIQQELTTTRQQLRTITNERDETQAENLELRNHLSSANKEIVRQRKVIQVMAAQE